MIDMAEVDTVEATPAFDALPARHKLFVARYLHCFNGAQAVREAGFGTHDARKLAYNLLRRPKITAALRELTDRLGATPERIEHSLAEIAFNNDLADMQPVLEGMPLDRARNQGVPTHLIKKIRAVRRVKGCGDQAYEVEDVSLELHDRLAALNSLAKIRAMLVNKCEVKQQSRQSFTFDLGRLDFANMPQEELERYAHATGISAGDLKTGIPSSDGAAAVAE